MGRERQAGAHAQGSCRDRGLNPVTATMGDSVTLAVASRTKELQAQGRTVFGFAAGEPDFDTPEHIKRAAIRALEAGATKYTPAAGLPALRAAVAEKLRRDNGLVYSPGQIVISNGAKHSLSILFTALCSPGDEVIIPSPYWLSYPEMVKVAGGKPVGLAGLESRDFKITPEQLEQAITRKTRALILNSPSNPVGHVYSRAELKALADVATARGVFIVSDEIYEKMVYDGAEHVSVASLSSKAMELTITVNGFSKAYAMPGWRLGYAAGPADVMRAVAAIQSHCASAPSTFAQFGGVEALTGSQQCVADMVRAFDERRLYLYQRLAAMPGITCIRPQGAFYVLPNIARFGMASVQFAERLLEEADVAVIPGIAFGSDAHVRLSYACSMDNIRGGMDKFEAFVKRL